MSTANTPKLDLLRIQDTWQFGDEAFNRFIDDADNKLVGIAHLDDKAHWSTWKKDTAYVKNDVVRIQNNKSHQYYQCITAGTSGTTEPTNNVTGSVVTDGTVTWMVMSLSEATSNGGVIQIWLSGNYYHRGDAVIYGTALYRCKVDHTSSDWNTDYDYWQEVFASIRLWRPVIYYFENDTVIVDNSIYKCIVAHKSGTVFDSTEEANWEMIGGAGGAKEWASNTKYVENELVTKDGILYQCNTAHTSGTDFGLDIANWNIVYASIVPWELNVYYPAGGVVTYEDCIYRCIAGNEATIDFDEVKDNYELIFANLQVWKPDVTYLAGSIVLYDGVLYRCNTTHTSANQFDVTMWDLVYANIRQYADNTIYKVGSIVIYNGKIYRCKNDYTSSIYGFNKRLFYNDPDKLMYINYPDTTGTYTLDLGSVKENLSEIIIHMASDVSYHSLVTSVTCYGSTNGVDYYFMGFTANSNEPPTDIHIGVLSSARYIKMDFTAMIGSGLNVYLSNLRVLEKLDNWELLSGRESIIYDWQSNKEYMVNDVVLHNNILYRNNKLHFSSVFNDDIDNWEIIYASIPSWQANEAYKEGQVVIHEGRLYRCKTDNKDTSFSGANWEYLNSIETWTSNKYYPNHILAVYEGSLYRCIVPHTSVTTFDETKWELFSGGGGGGSGTGYSQIDLINIAATQADPYVVDIAISSNPTHVLPPTDVLKQMTGKYTSENVMKFNPEDKDKFDYNDKGIKFEGGYMMINQSIPTDLEPAVPLGDNYTRISVPIDLSIYKSVESVVCL